ncbi:alpha-2-macroglobulin family protein [Aureispira sp. CCB-E]|uniref:alpha-2-macroglobulin family protein n=1 Tax=Aureispira sp. CCB-E TaxID=3051121 RepID=UPI00286904A7|nr:alpha-2-macroglobulin family protein [Aureispira sp. CCB-E]WMX12542.1 alpha-2-macroglobulin family protein [Aureispira sp. CCB-E]
MKPLIVTLFLLSFLNASFAQTNSYTQQWAKIDSLEHYRDLKPAIPLLNQLMEQSRHDTIDLSARAHYVKAFLFRSKYEVELELGLQDSSHRKHLCYLTVIDALKPKLLAQIDQSKDSIVNALLYAHLADLLIKYQRDFYVCNNIRPKVRRVIWNATGNYTLDSDPDPVQDSIDNMLRLYQEETSRYLLSAIASTAPKNVWAHDYVVLLGLDTITNTLPNYSLYDLLVDNAIDYLTHQSTYTTYKKTKKHYPFRDSLAFVRVEDFVQFDFTVADEHAKRIQIYKLYQVLLRHYLKHNQRNLLAKFDLERMVFGLNYNYEGIKKHNSYYLTRLLEMEQTYADVPMGTMISYEVAKDLFNPYGYHYPQFRNSIYNNRWNIKKAHDICQAAIQRFPNSVGAKNCQALLNQILQKELSLSIEAVTPTQQNILVKVTSKNIDKVYCKLLPLPDHYYKEKAQLDLLAKPTTRDSIWSAYIAKIASHYSHTWEEQIPLSNDFKNHSIEIKVPAQKAGAYLLIMSHKADFSYQKNGLVYAYFQVSDLAFIARARPQKGQSINEFFIVNRKNGAPIEQAKVQFLDKDWKKIDTQYSNNQGHLTTHLNRTKPYSIRIKKGKDQLWLDDHQLRYNDYSRLKKGKKTYLFTDKPIYRPGQNIQYKGILTQFNTDGTSDILPRQKTTIHFYDANQQKIASQIITTNEYGAYSGQFRIPNSILLGEMHLQDSLSRNKVYFDVEEYKKPTLQTKVESFVVLGEYRDTLVVVGTAKTFSGMPLMDAKIQYSILKEYQDTLKVATALIDAKGNFYVRLLIDKEKDSLIYQSDYSFHGTIVDLTGETIECSTHTSQKNLNYFLSTSNDSSIDVVFAHESNIVRHSTSTIANYKATKQQGSSTSKQPVSIQTYLIIEQLSTPKHPYINRLWSIPDTTITTVAAFEKDFPLYEAYDNQRHKANWVVLDTIYKDQVHAASKEWQLNTLNWAKGFYRIRFIYQDSSLVLAQEEIRYFNLQDTFPSPTYNVALLHYNKDSFLTGEPQDIVLLEVGSYFDDAHILLELENYEKVHEYRWLQPQAYQKVPIVLNEKHRGNLHYRLLSIYNNRFHDFENYIQVPWSNKDLTIEYLSFRDNLLPGQEEEWTIKITSPNGEAVASEILASMYDSSLDYLTSHSWHFDVYQNSYYRSLEDWSSKDNIKQRTFKVSQSPNWQLPTLKSYAIVDPNINATASFLKFNQFWYAHPPTPKDADGDGIPNEQDLEPNSLPYYPVDAHGRNIIIPVLELAEKEIATMERQESYILVDGIPCLSVVNDMDFNLYDYGGIPVEYGDPNDAILLSPSNNVGGATRNSLSANFNNVKIRSDLKESVFFYPHLNTDSTGSISIKFKMSEALSSWKFRLLAHTKDLKTTLSHKELVTKKKLMVMPNTPRFLRQGDMVDISTKVANLSQEPLAGKVTLQLFDALTNAPIDVQFEHINTIQSFDLKQEAVTKVHWTLKVPQDWTNPVLYKIIAKADNFSDGEQNQLPVISNKTLVLESLPILAHGQQKQNVVFKGLKHNASTTLQQHRFTLEMSTNPAWEALLSLPYLIEYPYECSEQLFSRFYANSLATKIITENPKLEKLFETWAAKDVPSSSLDKLLNNPTLKSILLEETPWVLQSNSSAERQKHLGQLLKLSRMAKEFQKVRHQLLERQSEDGGFSWFKGGHSSPFITQYILSGLAKLEQLGANAWSKNKAIQQMLKKALDYTDQQIIQQYQQLAHYYQNNKQVKPDSDAMRLEDNLSPSAIQYLYTKSFFWDATSIQKDSALAQSIQYYLEQAKLHWRNKSIYQQGLLALAAHRIRPQSKYAQMIADSLKNQAIIDSTQGMYWTQPWGFYSHQLPIETQAIMIELFEEVAKDDAAVYLLKLWLLRQKKGTAWASTKATTTACYALLMSGNNWLDHSIGLDIQIGKESFSSTTMDQELGTGYFQKTWPSDSINKDMAIISITNKNNTPALGAAYWQYFEQFENIHTFQETPLKIKKELFLQTPSTTGVVHTPIQTTDIKPGDLILVKIELEVGQTMEYLHLKDMRAAGFEPTNVLSRYHYQNGIGYYQMTKDASSNFFFRELKKGAYTFEYTLRAVHKGQFSNGITTIQSMYAPEFTAHSEAIDVIIK